MTGGATGGAIKTGGAANGGCIGQTCGEAAGAKAGDATPGATGKFGGAIIASAAARMPSPMLSTSAGWRQTERPRQTRPHVLVLTMELARSKPRTTLEHITTHRRTPPSLVPKPPQTYALSPPALRMHRPPPPFEEARETVHTRTHRLSANASSPLSARGTDEKKARSKSRPLGL